MRERREPTHVVVVEVPLYVPEGEARDFDPFRDALRAVLAVSHAAFSDAICDDPQVRVERLPS